MLRPVHLLAALLLGVSTCAPAVVDDSGPSDSGPSGSLSWYTTCGDPVCHGYDAAAHSTAACTTEAVGDACTRADLRCDPVSDCNAELVCASSDPKLEVGGCPISRREAKTDIHYLDPAGVQALDQALLQVRLADYRYKVEAPDAPHHLGFIIDDQPAGSPAVLPGGQRVDLYGYTSMAVAALQVQQAEIQSQKARIAAQEARIAALEARLDALSAQAQAH